MKHLLFFPLLFIFSSTLIACDQNNLFGFVEEVWLPDANIYLPAKLDTGAKTASLHATHIRLATERGIDYVIFKIANGKGGHIELKKKQIGNSKIKMRAEQGPKTTAKRPVIMMPVRIGDKEHKIRVNLTNREHFLYPLLLGREAIEAFNGVVDPSLTYHQKNIKEK